MELIADILLISGALAAAAYCVVLSRRLKRFTDLENGVGGAIAVLSAQVDDMTKTLKIAQTSAAGSAQSLDQLTGKAEGVARRLELLVASMHDLPDPPATDQMAERTVETATQKSADPAPQTPELKQDDTPPMSSNGPLFLSQRNQIQEATE